MIVVIDTNALHSDSWSMDSTWLNTIIATAGFLNITICIPKVVIEETIRQYKKDAYELQANLNPLLKKLDQMTNNHSVEPFTMDDAATAVESQRCRVYNLFEDDRIIILSTPSVDHDTLIDQYVQGKRPFKAEGTGYKDALVWYSLLEAGENSTDEDIVLITNNSSDFSRSKRQPNEVHMDLQQIATDHGIDPSRISLVPDLYHFVQQYISPRLEEVDESLKEEIVSGRRFSLGEELAATIEDWLVDASFHASWMQYLDDGQVGLGGFVGGLTILSASDIEVSKTQERKMLVQAKVEFAADLAADISLYSEYYDLVDGAWDMDTRTVHGELSATLKAVAALEWNDLSREIETRSLDSVELMELKLPLTSDDEEHDPDRFVYIYRPNHDGN